MAEKINKFVLALSYSYFAAAIFHIFVNYIPTKLRQSTMRPFIDHKFFCISELLRQSKNIAINPFNMNNHENDREWYCNLFSEVDFEEAYEFGKGCTRYEVLEGLRWKINDNIVILLAYRDFLSDDEFIYLNYVLSSEFIQNGLIPEQKIGNNYNCNQNVLGECLFDLYELSKKNR